MSNHKSYGAFRFKFHLHFTPHLNHLDVLITSIKKKGERERINGAKLNNATKEFQPTSSTSHELAGIKLRQRQLLLGDLGDGDGVFYRRYGNSK